MKKKKYKSIRIFVDIMVLGTLLVGVGNFAFAATTGTVTATVTLQNVSVSVTDGSVSYGILAASATKTTLSGGLNDQQTATNAGNVAEDFNIKGQNSTNWTLAATAGSDQYVHKFCIATCGTEGSPGAGFTALTTSYASLKTNVATSGTQTFDLLVQVPSSSATYISQSVDVTVQAVAH
jgi:hypothetical protein